MPVRAGGGYGQHLAAEASLPAGQRIDTGIDAQAGGACHSLRSLPAPLRTSRPGHRRLQHRAPHHRPGRLDRRAGHDGPGRRDRPAGHRLDARTLARRHGGPGRRGTCPGRRRCLSRHPGPRSPHRTGEGAADRGACFMPAYGWDRDRWPALWGPPDGAEAVRPHLHAGCDRAADPCVVGADGHNVTGPLKLVCLHDDTDTMCPSACAMPGPAATYRTVHVAAQRASMVLAPPSVATSRSPARIPARASSAADSCKMALSPGCLLPAEKRSARYTPDARGGTNPADSTPMSPPAGRPGRTMVTTLPDGSTA